MNVIDHFAKNGYIVLAFDASGTDDSEGKAGGFPQEFSDAHHVLEYVRNTRNFRNILYCFGEGVWGLIPAQHY